jgi:hypothetical protein
VVWQARYLIHTIVDHGPVGVIGDVVGVWRHFLGTLVHVLVHHRGGVQRQTLEGIHRDQDRADVGLHTARKEID